jgi:hypothetical protein
MEITDLEALAIRMRGQKNKFGEETEKERKLFGLWRLDEKYRD